MNRPPAAVPPWSTPLDAGKLILRGVTFQTASRVSLVVGTLLSVVNQGSIILAGHATVPTALRIVVNYVVPFTVASIGYLAPFRQGAHEAIAEPALGDDGRADVPRRVWIDHLHGSNRRWARRTS